MSIEEVNGAALRAAAVSAYTVYRSLNTGQPPWDDLRESERLGWVVIIIAAVSTYRDMVML